MHALRVGLVAAGFLALAPAAPALTTKAASTQTLGARSTVTPVASAFGGFEIRSATTVYIAVRGNSLGTLGVTANFLDAPRVRLYNAQGADLAFDANNNPGFNGCIAGSDFSGPVVVYYQVIRNQPVSPRDSCMATSLPAGVYTFSVTPSIPGVTTVTTASVPSSGEVLFEVILGP